MDVTKYIPCLVNSGICLLAKQNFAYPPSSLRWLMPFLLLRDDGQYLMCTNVESGGAFRDRVGNRFVFVSFSIDLWLNCFDRSNRNDSRFRITG